MKRLAFILCLVLGGRALFAQTKGGLVGVRPVSQQVISNEVKEMPNCVVVTLGVGAFNDENITQLKYVDQDCEEFFASVSYYLSFDYNCVRKQLPQEGVKRTLKEAFSLFEQTVSESSSGDIVMFYLSGHGETERGQYYFPMYDSSLTPQLNNLLTGTHIADYAERIAEKGVIVLVFLDTCKSGSINLIAKDSVTNGGIAYFPASTSKDTITESVRQSASDYGVALRNVFRKRDADVITVEDIGTALQNVASGEQSPKYVNSPRVDIAKWVIVSDVIHKHGYLKDLHSYYDHIQRAQECLKNQNYHNAINFLESALKLDSFIANSDKEKYGLNVNNEINNLNSTLRRELKRDSNTAPRVWQSLSVINSESPVLKLTRLELATLFYKCGLYYKSVKEFDIAYSLFKKAYDYGDRTNAPYEMADLGMGGVLSSNICPSQEETNDFLQLACKNGNSSACAILNPVVINGPEPPDPNYVYAHAHVSPFAELFYDGYYIGGGVTSDFNLFPLGIKGDFFWGLFHIGLDANMGSGLFYTQAYAYTSSTATVTVNGQTIEPTVELVSSDAEKTRGMFSFTVTPGLFYKYVSLDCGFGKIWTKTSRIDTYKYTYGTSSSTGEGGTSITTSTSTDTTKKELVEIKNNYFAIKPGLSGIIPLRDDLSIVLGASYRICPKNKEMNGFECSIGLAFLID